jgi:hemoglobin
MQSDLEGRAANSAAIQQRAAEHMASIGVTPEFIDSLVEAFYLRIQQHETLGEVFDAHIQSRWPEHMARMKLFWNALAFKTGSYSGRPVQAHLNVHGLTPELFPQWLQLFRLTLEDNKASEEAREWFYATAERIAKSLTLSLFYNPALDDPKLGKQ